MSKRLLDLSDSSDREESNGLNVNTDFAQNYDNWRRREEMQKLRDKYGPNLDILSDSDQSFVSHSDDETHDSDSESDQSLEGQQQVFDHNFFKVYSALKCKNPVIYDKNIRFFDENEENSNEVIVNKSKEKTMTLKDYHKKLIKEKKGITDEDIQQMNGFEDKPIGYYEELDEIRNEFKSVLNSDDDTDEQLIKGKAQPIPQLKDKTIDFLDENNERNNDSDLKYLKNYWKSDDQLEESEKFLKDYIINKRYVNKSEEELYKKQDFNETQVSDTETNGDNDMFETIDGNNKDNENELKIKRFHFEEPNSLSIKRFPRSVETIRDTTLSDKRALKRSETKERKKREKDIELKRLRKLKKEELKQRLNKIQEISGNEKIDLNDLDLNGILDDENDFDSEKYDQKMQTLFGDNYYENENLNKTKPKFEYMPEIDDLEYNQELDNKSDQNNQNNSKLNKKSDKKKKKISKAMDEIGIFEDLIGSDLGTRYKYRTVESNDFGLTVEEILFSEDKELNKWCSIQKMSQYRDDVEERYDVKSYANKGTNSELKQKILKSFYDKQNVNQKNEEIEIKSNNNSKRKKRKHKKPKFTIVDIGDKNNGKIENKDNVSKNSNSNKNRKFRKNKQKPKQLESHYSSVSIERLKAYGLSNRKIKKIKHKNKQ